MKRANRTMKLGKKGKLEEKTEKKEKKKKKKINIWKREIKEVLFTMVYHSTLRVWVRF